MTDRPDDETLLAQFGQWLRDARAEAEAEAETEAANDLDTDRPGIGLERLVEEFTALRQEVKLQTKSSRGVQDQAEALLPAMRQAIEEFRAVVPDEERAADAASRPLVEALADLDEALDRGRLEIERAERRLEENTGRTLAALDALDIPRWRPWSALARRYRDAARAVFHEEVEGPHRAIFGALLEGYALIQARLGRALKKGRIERIACEGRPVDPERMTVVEVVDDARRAPGEVIEEVRRGYTWQGRVLRYAEVRAAAAARAGASGDSNGIPKAEG